MARALMAGLLLGSMSLSCLSPPEIMVECETDSECLKGQACVSGSCADICRNDGDCRPGQRCEGQVCVGEPLEGLDLTSAGGGETTGDPTDPGATTCSVTATPVGGDLHTPFGLAWASNGTECALAVDSVTIAAGCNGALTLQGMALGEGAHPVTLWAGGGPSGGTQCTTTIHVGDATWCNLNVTPSSGDLSTALSISSSSNGSSCRLEIDGDDAGARDCATATTMRGWELGPGSHQLTLRVGAGPTGPATCTANVTLADSSYCWSEISPPNGDSNTLFHWTGEANGDTCVWYWNDTEMYEIDCELHYYIRGFDPGPGDHTLRVVATGGPTGASQCSVSFHVEEASWCAIQMAPTSGSVNTTFAWEAASNGQDCTWSVDGVNQGSVPCVGSATFRGGDFGTGAHTLGLTLATGPTGPRTCTKNFTVY